MKGQDALVTKAFTNGYVDYEKIYDNVNPHYSIVNDDDVAATASSKNTWSMKMSRTTRTTPKLRPNDKYNKKDIVKEDSIPDNDDNHDTHDDIHNDQKEK